MGKRLTSGDKWSDPWFRALRPEYKILFMFVCETCDLAGVWQVDRGAAEFFIGMAITWDGALSAMDGRITELAGGHKWYVTKFVSFQNPNGLFANNKAHVFIHNLMKRHGLAVPPLITGKASGVGHPCGMPAALEDEKTHSLNASISGEMQEGAAAKIEADKIAMKQACWDLSLDDGPKSVEEWTRDLKKHAKVKSLDEAIACMQWAVPLVRRATGKEVRYSRHVANDLPNWVDNKSIHFKPRKIA